jgi:maltose phosphorylase
MTKVATRYLEVDPWKIEERGFHRRYGRVSESIFSLANEFMGVRGYFEEGYSGQKMVGSYFNGIFERFFIEHPFAHIGMASQEQKMLNSVDWLYTRISLDGEQLDLAKCKYRDFVRSLDLRDGVLRRSFVWKSRSGKEVAISFERFTSMEQHNLGFQRISLEALNFTGKVNVEVGLDFTLIHHNTSGFLSRPFVSIWQQTNQGSSGPITAIQAKTPVSGHAIFSSFQLRLPDSISTRLKQSTNFISRSFELPLKRGQARTVDKIVVNTTEKRTKADSEAFWNRSIQFAQRFLKTDYDSARRAQAAYWRDVWNRSDITIDGDCLNQQGIRFCIFHLHQTYHGVDPSLNVPAKGLTGDGYDGKTWWDTETYCLPFYMFNNPMAARNLLEYRYKTLPHACRRSKEVDGCTGARYPMSTIDGTETCYVWQHGDLEVHVSAAVAYGIWHYEKVVGEKDFLYSKGIEVLIQVCRFFASRGQFAQKSGEFGFYNVMGADEFHMMVNNNVYTNCMAKRTFEYTLDVIRRMRRQAPEALSKVTSRTGLADSELRDWKFKAARMRTNFDDKALLFEQHDGFFDLPHINCSKIPLNDYPIYKNWPYLKIFRYDMLKQPDVLLLLFFFSKDYSLKCKRVNYEYYEPRCSHESSLSPAIHSILAAEIGKDREAYRFFGHATRLDLDDYNRNAWAGLHITSMAGAWMNIVQGFGGLRTDGNTLAFRPSIPSQWKNFTYKMVYRGSIMDVSVSGKEICLRVDKGSFHVQVFDKMYLLDSKGLCIALPPKRATK